MFSSADILQVADVVREVILLLLLPSFYAVVWYCFFAIRLIHCNCPTILHCSTKPRSRASQLPSIFLAVMLYY